MSCTSCEPHYWALQHLSTLVQGPSFSSSYPDPIDASRSDPSLKFYHPPIGLSDPKPGADLHLSPSGMAIPNVSSSSKGARCSGANGSLSSGCIKSKPICKQKVTAIKMTNLNQEKNKPLIICQQSEWGKNADKTKCDLNILLIK